MENNNSYICSVCHSENYGTAFEVETGDPVCGECIKTGYIAYLKQKKSNEWWAISVFKTELEAETAAKDAMNFPFIIDYKIEKAFYGQQPVQQCCSNSKIQEISAKELKKRLQIGDTSFQMIDVREAKELEKGSIPGVIHITVKELPYRITILPKDKEYIIVCSHGYRARYICEFLQENGFKVRRLSNGMLGWNGFGFIVPVMDTVTAVIKKFRKG